MGVKVDVLCVGNSAVDVPLKPMNPDVFAIDSYPVDRIIPTIGGSATNVSVIATRLGLKVALATLLGDDMLGKFILSYCKENGVDVSSVAIDDSVRYAAQCRTCQSRRRAHFRGEQGQQHLQVWSCQHRSGKDRRREASRHREHLHQSEAGQRRSSKPCSGKPEVTG